MNRWLAKSFVAILVGFLASASLAQEGVAFTSPRADALRGFTIQQQGLNSSALKLSRPQKAEIDKILAAYVNEQIMLEDRTPTEQRRSEQAANARAAALQNLVGALGKVMNSEQRATWETAKRASMERGMFPASK